MTPAMHSLAHSLFGHAHICSHAAHICANAMLRGTLSAVCGAVLCLVHPKYMPQPYPSQGEAAPTLFVSMMPFAPSMARASEATRRAAATLCRLCMLTCVTPCREWGKSLLHIQLWEGQSKPLLDSAQKSIEILQEKGFKAAQSGLAPCTPIRQTLSLTHLPKDLGQRQKRACTGVSRPWSFSRPKCRFMSCEVTMACAMVAKRSCNTQVPLQAKQGDSTSWPILFAPYSQTRTACASMFFTCPDPCA